MDLESALKRIGELEKEVALLKTQMNNQYAATENLMRRVGKLEHSDDGGQLAPGHSIMG
jgi:phage host-nuclease inhibitor protein Gam